MENYMSEKKVITGKVRFNYVNLIYPKKIGESRDAKYSVCLLIEKGDHETLNKIYRAIEVATMEAKDRWGEDIVKDIKSPIYDGDTLSDLKWEFIGKYFINASSKIKPGIVDKNLKAITDTSEVYSGCYGRASISFYPYRIEDKVGIAIGLNNVQVLEDGEYLGNRPTAEDDFAV